MNSLGISMLTSNSRLFSFHIIVVASFVYEEAHNTGTESTDQPVKQSYKYAICMALRKIGQCRRQC